MAAEKVGQWLQTAKFQYLLENLKSKIWFWAYKEFNIISSKWSPNYLTWESLSYLHIQDVIHNNVSLLSHKSHFHFPCSIMSSVCKCPVLDLSFNHSSERWAVSSRLAFIKVLKTNEPDNLYCFLGEYQWLSCFVSLWNKSFHNITLFFSLERLTKRYPNQTKKRDKKQNPE